MAEKSTTRDMSLSVKGLNIAAKSWGSVKNPPVLALHGWMDNSASFDFLAPLLPNHFIVAPDLPGHGQSGHLCPAAGFHFIDFVPTILEIVEQYKWSSFILLGHSMGAAISTLVAGCIPSTIEKLILLEGIGPLSQEAAETPERLMKALAQEKAILARGRRIFPTKEMAVKARLKDSDLDEKSAACLVERALFEDKSGFHFTHDPRLKSPSRIRLTEEMVLAFLSKIDCPTLFIEAEKGWPFPKNAVETRMKCIKTLERKRVPGGHHVHMTNPERVSPIIEDFISKS